MKKNAHMAKVLPKFYLFAIFCLLVTLSLWLTSNEAFGQKGSKPTFTQYKTSEMETPLPSAPNWLNKRDTWIVVTVLTLLVCSTISGLWLRSRCLLLITSLLAVLISGFWLGGCPCPVGSIQNVALTLLDSTYIAPWTIGVLFLVPLFVALLFGRTFCGGTCPLGALQELIAVWPIRIPREIDDILGLLRYIVLGLAILFAGCGLSFLVCRYDPFVPIFRGITGWGTVLVWSSLILLVGLFIARPYCRFFCPYGALLSLCGHLAIWRVTVAPGKCDQCRLCETVCPYNAIDFPTKEPSWEERQRGVKQFLVALLLFPMIVALFGWIGSLLAFPLAQLHPVVKRAELVRAEETGLVDRFGAFDETLAHYRGGEENESLYQRAAQVYQRLQYGTLFFGLWVGVVLGIKGITLTVRRKRTEYQTDGGRCFSCGRCFWYCPNQKEQRLFLQEKRE